MIAGALELLHQQLHEAWSCQASHGQSLEHCTSTGIECFGDPTQHCAHITECTRVRPLCLQSMRQKPFQLQGCLGETLMNHQQPDKSSSASCTAGARSPQDLRPSKGAALLCLGPGWHGWPRVRAKHFKSSALGAFGLLYQSLGLRVSKSGDVPTRMFNHLPHFRPLGRSPHSVNYLPFRHILKHIEATVVQIAPGVQHRWIDRQDALIRFDTVHHLQYLFGAFSTKCESCSLQVHEFADSATDSATKASCLLVRLWVVAGALASRSRWLATPLPAEKAMACWKRRPRGPALQVINKMEQAISHLDLGRPAEPSTELASCLVHWVC